MAHRFNRSKRRNHMKEKLVFIAALVACAGVVIAGDPPYPPIDIEVREACDLTYIDIMWDFSVDDGGFQTAICEAGGVSTWEYGAHAYGTGWGTTLAGTYPNNSGDGLIAPAFTVTNDRCLMEISHYYDIETNYDGGNVTVNGEVVVPMGGYDGTISTSVNYYAYCVDMEDGFTSFGGYQVDCFDLSAYMDQEVVVELDYGSDSSVTYDGWYILSIAVGTDGATPTETKTWGRVKSIYR
jgi:hypothetical protein